jgi:hypothetical protein
MGLTVSTAVLNGLNVRYRARMSQLDMFRCKYECLLVYCVVVTTRAAMRGRRHSVLIVVAPPCEGDTLVDVVPCGGSTVVGLGLAFV